MDEATEIVRTDLYRGNVEVRAGGYVLANTRSAVRLREGGYPDVYYVPREDVDMTCLAPSDTKTVCPHKGTAGYWSLKTPGATIKDVAWSYEDPKTMVRAITGHLAFYTDKVEVLVKPYA